MHAQFSILMKNFNETLLLMFNQIETLNTVQLLYVFLSLSLSLSDYQITYPIPEFMPLLRFTLSYSV